MNTHWDRPLVRGVWARGVLAVLVPLLLIAACTSSAASPSSSVDVAGASATVAATATLTPEPAGTSTSEPTSTPTPVPTPTPIPRVAATHTSTVLGLDQVSPTAGWVYTKNGVYQTLDNGSTWARVTPPSLITSKIRGIGAFDANRALLAVVDVARFQSTIYVWRTSDGGATWTYVALPVVPNGYCPTCEFSTPGDPQVFIDYVDAGTAFLWFGMRTGFDGTTNHKYETTDGGATWTALTYDPPDPLHSVAGTDRLQFLSASVGTAEQEAVISSTTSGWGAFVDVRLHSEVAYFPTIYFVGASEWYADVGLDLDSATLYHYAVSTDQGRHWTERTVNVPSISADSVSVAFFSATRWIATIAAPSAGFPHDGVPRTYSTTDAGAHWTALAAQPFQGSRPVWLDASNAWTGVHPWDFTNSTTVTKLYATSNGGGSWRNIAP
jgi:photosystem II stability/assembly factor-like uncharacterized protein